MLAIAHRYLSVSLVVAIGVNGEISTEESFFGIKNWNIVFEFSLSILREVMT
jgi:hypothetical protein